VAFCSGIAKSIVFLFGIQYISSRIIKQKRTPPINFTAMIKNWKSLFVKSDNEETPAQPANENLSFPVSSHTSSTDHVSQPLPTIDPSITEVLKVYENGLDSINMPGYDFYEFYQTVMSTGSTSEQTYKMAFHMARTLDRTISPSKLLSDAEFYISKINEVHSQYVSQGQQKLSGIQERKAGEKSRLQNDIDRASSRIAELKAELQQLESEISTKKSTLMKLEDAYYPQEKSIREKLTANDIAKKTSIDRLNAIKDGIQRFIKD
jgi:hypothetical protein